MSNAATSATGTTGSATPGPTERTRFGLTWTGDASFVRRAEDLGVDSLWAGGHITFRSATREPLVRLAQLAVLSTTLTIGTSIAVLPLYQPAVIGKQIADIDRDCAGRLIFGVGAGGDWPPEFDACQVALEGRGARMDEAIDVLRAMWGGPVDHDGPRFPMQGIRFDPPHRRGGPPIVIAGRKPAAIRRAALRGDGWMPYLYSPRRYAESVAAIRALASEHGRSLADFHWMVFVFVHADSDGRRARDDAARILNSRYGQDMSAMLPSVAVVGSTDEVAEQLGAFARAGAAHIILAPLESDDAAAEHLFKSVVPLVNAAQSRRTDAVLERTPHDV